MINLAIGIAIGAVFAPFWMKLYGWGKLVYQKFMTSPPAPPATPPAA